jgi:uncharacterized protein (TIGR00255 family)
VLSMTGFGRSEIVLGHIQYSIEIKSVNHRYLDIRFRLPPTLAALELPIAETLRSHVERGSFEVAIRSRVPTSATSISGATRFVVDEQAARTLWSGCQWLEKELKVPLPKSPDIFAFANRVFIAVEETQDSSTLWQDLRPPFEEAVSELKKMRRAEGKRLEQVLLESLTELRGLTDQVAELAPEQPKKIRERLEAKIQQWKLSSEIDSQRLEWEIALLAERSEITEEIDRLRMHCKEFEANLKAGKAIGRKLDFLTQELHREVNTIGSKTTLAEITRLVVTAKAAIEKLREQVQNVE